MGHRLNAVLLVGPFDRDAAAGFDLRHVSLDFGITMFFIADVYCDHWAEKLDIPGFRGRYPIYNANVIHHMINRIADEPLFAVIATDYFGGVGDQHAGVYRGDQEIYAPTARSTINDALRLLGVEAVGGKDEFDTLGLGRYRDSSAFIPEHYWDDSPEP